MTEQYKIDQMHARVTEGTASGPCNRDRIKTAIANILEAKKHQVSDATLTGLKENKRK